MSGGVQPCTATCECALSGWVCLCMGMTHCRQLAVQRCGCVRAAGVPYLLQARAACHCSMARVLFAVLVPHDVPPRPLSSQHPSPTSLTPATLAAAPHSLASCNLPFPFHALPPRRSFRATKDTHMIGGFHPAPAWRTRLPAPSRLCPPAEASRPLHPLPASALLLLRPPLPFIPCLHDNRQKCLFAHPTEAARRRDLRLYPHAAVACPRMSKARTQCWPALASRCRVASSCSSARYHACGGVGATEGSDSNTWVCAALCYAALRNAAPCAPLLWTLYSRLCALRGAFI